MKLSDVSFGRFRQLLLDLGFLEEKEASGWRFEHPGTKTIFLFRPYQLREKVNVSDIASTRVHLEWRGLVASDAFEELLKKTPA